jgi:hypothetical protein
VFDNVFQPVSLELDFHHIILSVYLTYPDIIRSQNFTMDNEAESNNPLVTALPPSGDNAQRSIPSQDSFWKQEITQSVTQLEYMMNEETFSIKGVTYEGFIRIWKGLLGGRKQLNGSLAFRVIAGFTTKCLE